MPIVEPVNTQQIIQMASHVEKVQQTMQHQPTVTAEQLESERSYLDELKRVEVQDLEQTNESNQTNPDGASSRRRLRIRRARTTPEPEQTAGGVPESSSEEPYHGQQINLIV